MACRKKKEKIESQKRQTNSTANRDRRRWFKLHEPRVREHLANQRSSLSGPRFLASTFGQPVEMVEDDIAREVREWFKSKSGSRGIPQRIELSKLIDATDLIMRGMGKAVLDPRSRNRRALKTVIQAYGDCVPLYKTAYLMEGPEKIEQIKEEDDRLIDFVGFAKNSTLFRELRTKTGQITVKLSDMGSAVGYGVDRLKSLKFVDKIQGVEGCPKMQEMARYKEQISVQCATELDFPDEYFHVGVWNSVLSHIPVALSVKTLLGLNRILKFGAPVMMTASLNPGKYSVHGEEIEATEIEETTRPILIPGHTRIDIPKCTTVLFTPEKFKSLVTIAGFQVFDTFSYITGKITDQERQMVLFTTKVREVKEHEALMKWYNICPEAENCM